MNLKELSDFQIGQVKGYLACKKKENLTEALELEQNLQTRSGMRWAYNRFLKEQFRDSVLLFKKAIKDNNHKAKNIYACRICDYAVASSADEGRYQITTGRDGKSRIEEVYSEDDIEEVKKKLDEDPSMEIVEQAEDGSIWLARKQDSDEAFNELVSQFQEVGLQENIITSDNVPLKVLFIVDIKDINNFESFLDEFCTANNLMHQKIDVPELVYVVSNDKLKCTVICVSQANKVEASIYYMSAPWFVNFLNELAYQSSGKILTPSGVFDGVQFVQYASEQEVFDSLGVPQLVNVNRY